MIRPTAYCDECGRPKNEGNHWFKGWVGPGTFHVQQSHIPLNAIDPTHPNIMDLCSESCAVKAMAKAIGSTSGEQNG